MRLIEFVTSLLPRIRKDEVMEDLRISLGELTNGVMPAYDDAAKYFKDNKPKSKKVSELALVFYRNYDLAKGGRQPSFVNEVEARLKSVRENLAFVNDQNEDLLEHDIIKEGLTAKKAILVRSAEQLSFITRYAIDVLNYVYIAEAAELGAEHTESHKLAPALEKKIVANIGNFARLLAVFGDDHSSFKKRFDNMPDVVVNAKTYQALSAVYSDAKLDPLSALMMPGFESNPIYHLRIVIAEWQADRYKSYKDKKKMLELRLMNLKMLQEKQQDPKLDKEIEYIQSRVESIEFKMAKMEDSVK